jgi:hypothetical protein
MLLSRRTRCQSLGGVIRPPEPRRTLREATITSPGSTPAGRGTLSDREAPDVPAFDTERSSTPAEATGVRTQLASTTACATASLRSRSERGRLPAMLLMSARLTGPTRAAHSWGVPRRAYLYWVEPVAQ